MLFFNFCLFHFFKFQVTIEGLYQSNQNEGSYEVLLRQKYFWSPHLWQWNECSFQIVWNLHGNAFCFFIFSKWKKYYKLNFDDTFKIYCCTLYLSKLKLHKRAISKLRVVEYTISFLSISFLRLFERGFSQKQYQKTIIFNTNF